MQRLLRWCGLVHSTGAARQHSTTLPTAPHNPLQLPEAVLSERASAPSSVSPASPFDLHVFFSDWAELRLPETHRFPIEKYRRTRERLEAAWACCAAPGTHTHRVVCRTHPAPLASVGDVVGVHDRAYIARFVRGELTPRESRVIGLSEAAPSQHVLRTFASVGGCLAATRLVLAGKSRASGCLAGGMHHGFADSGEGFCVVNDCAVVAWAARHEFGVNRVLVCDLDVHQGNGTAKIFAEDRSVFTYSMHQAGGYPFSTRTHSDLDVPLPDGCDDGLFMASLRQTLPRVLDSYRPGFVVFQAGVDALANDRLGRLAMSHAGLMDRNRFVVRETLQRGIPLMVCFGGGYNKDEAETVAAHANVYLALAEVLGEIASCTATGES